ncbi:SDR family oxidoreductase [Planktomarina temperata]|nr:SDR family oxidoreductase [Planktomarina temperata]
MNGVLITAGGNGIGRAMGQAFAAAGFRVWVTDVEPASLEACPADWQKSLVDASDETQVARLFADIQKTWGRLEAICANAGIAGPTAAVEEIDLSAWQRCVSVNLEGAFLAAKYGGPMLKAARGAIVLTSSTAGLYGYPNRAPYAAAKWGIIGLIKTLAMEWGPEGVRANAICPGAVEGPRMQGVMEREAAAKGTDVQHIYDGYASGTSMRSLVAAEDIANMAVFLCSAGARLVSGQVIAVDGHTENPDPKV